MLFKERVDVYCENHYTHVFRGQNAELWNVDADRVRAISNIQNVNGISAVI
jgi:hypothetical protein